MINLLSLSLVCCVVFAAFLPSGKYILWNFNQINNAISIRKSTSPTPTKKF